MFNHICEPPNAATCARFHSIAHSTTSCIGSILAVSGTRFPLPPTRSSLTKRRLAFNPEVYKHRFSAERTFAWIDKFKALLVRFERKDAYFFGLHCLAFALISLRDLVS